MAANPHDELFQVMFPCAARPIAFAFMTRTGRDFIAGQIRRDGLAAYERPAPGLIVSLCQGEEPGTFLDVGANTGIFSLLAATAAPMLRVHAFEPVPHIRQVLEANLALNAGLAARIHVETKALSNREGTLAFFETENDQGFIATSSSLELAHASGVDSGLFTSTEVEVSTLDAWAEAQEDLAPIRLIKMDVETHEYAVVEGGRGVIRRHRPTIILEVLPGANTESIQQLLDQEGYLAFGLAADAFLQSFQVSYTRAAENVLLCPSERIGQVFWLARQHGLRIGTP